MIAYRTTLVIIVPKAFRTFHDQCPVHTRVLAMFTGTFRVKGGERFRATTFCFVTVERWGWCGENNWNVVVVVVERKTIEMWWWRENNSNVVVVVLGEENNRILWPEDLYKCAAFYLFLSLHFAPEELT